MDKLVKKCLLTEQEKLVCSLISIHTLDGVRDVIDETSVHLLTKAIPIISEEYRTKLEGIRDQVVELTKKLNDREADLINAKCEASEEIKRELESAKKESLEKQQEAAEDKSNPEWYGNSRYWQGYEHATSNAISITHDFRRKRGVK